ncbi:MAG TPA: hypothetical protein VJY85_00415 [Candidatus Limnocylindria bacterium]|nr:hypothetical protein [Candidatus Limnocylindria bacterium]
MTVRAAAATAAVVGFFVATVLPRATAPLTDGDVWWHIRAGEEVLRSGAISRVDTWSIVANGHPWTSQDWLTNVVLAVGNDLGPWGRTGLSFLFGGLTLLAFWILWRSIALRVRQIGWASRIAWLSVGLVLAGPVLGVRVQVLDLVLATAVVWVLWRYMVDPRRRWLIALPLITVAWANLHAGWVLVFLLGGAVLLGEAADRLLRRTVEGQPLSWRALRDLGVALLISAAALVINPNGVDLYRYPIDTVGMQTLSRYVLEWYPASLDNLFGQLLAAFVAIVVIPVLVVGRHRLRSADALILVGLTVMAFQAIRFLLILGPIGGAIAAVVLSPIISNSAFGRRIAPILARLSTPRAGRFGTVNMILIAGVAVLGIGIALARVYPAAAEREVAQKLPVGAVAWMDGHDPGARIFNRYEWGGYIGQHRPGQPIFMDGRADVYGDDLIAMYVSVIGLQGDPQRVLDRYGIDHVVLPPNWKLAQWLDHSPLWQRDYQDATAVVWRRR